MEIFTTDQPAKMAGEAISKSINEHEGDVVCLLSGGSALDVVEHLQLEDKSECRTIFMMGDERGSREPKLNNTVQLQARYPDHVVTKNLIESIPTQNESLENFATRVEKTFLEKISKLTNPKIISLLGMGDDGHTAGIFPLPAERFSEVYKEDGTYVPVQVESLTIDSRASFSPHWIQNTVDEIYAYVTGESKAAMLNLLLNESKELHERPAELIKRHKQAHLYTDQVIDN